MIIFPLRLALVSLLTLFLSSLPPSQQSKENSMTQLQAAGPFDVKITPLDPAFKFDENPYTRFSIDKQFHGDLEAVSKGEMLAAGSPAKGAGGYVAIERVSGSLHGHTGTFVLQHNATMQHGAYELNVIVVPESGTGQLAGLSGTMQIIIAAGGKHSYNFTYTLPDNK